MWTVFSTKFFACFLFVLEKEGGEGVKNEIKKKKKEMDSLFGPIRGDTWVGRRCQIPSPLMNKKKSSLHVAPPNWSKQDPIPEKKYFRRSTQASKIPINIILNVLIFIFIYR